MPPVLQNTGTQRLSSRHGLLTTVAYKLGPETPVMYALEGVVVDAVDGGVADALKGGVVNTLDSEVLYMQEVWLVNAQEEWCRVFL